MLMIKSQSILIWLLWFPANRVIGGQVPGVLVAQAEIIQTGKSSYFDSDFRQNYTQLTCERKHVG